MKTKIQMQNNNFLFMLFISLIIMSCSDDDINEIPDPEPGPTGTELSGELHDDLQLDPEKDYQLTGILSVEEGATLSIPAGTKITAETGENIYIVIQKGADIKITGTAEDPVIMASADGNPGDWGGLLILGEAETTAGVDVIAEVGGLVYGGNNNEDNSGSINYLIIEGAGAQINSESQYNGLTLYSVGSGTTIQNVALLNGADDGVEFFGGTVSVSNIYLEDNEDDAIDWTEGWSGEINNAYILHTIEGFSTAIEADGINNNPKIENITAVSETGGTALQFKKESGATITGLSLEGYETAVDMADAGSLENVMINGKVADPEKDYQNEATVDPEIFTWVLN